jgi:hypothetical protein
MIFVLGQEMTRWHWSGDKCDICILINMYNPPTNGKFCDINGNAIKPRIT